MKRDSVDVVVYEVDLANAQQASDVVQALKDGTGLLALVTRHSIFGDPLALDSGL